MKKLLALVLLTPVLAFAGSYSVSVYAGMVNSDITRDLAPGETFISIPSLCPTPDCSSPRQFGRSGRGWALVQVTNGKTSMGLRTARTPLGHRSIQLFYRESFK